MTTAMDAKKKGQHDSLFDLLPDDDALFRSEIGRIRPGERFTINRFRVVLDQAKVPEKQRAGLMRKACTDGFVEPVTTIVEGKTVHVGVPSTGASARGAYVKLYTRTGVKVGA